MVVKGFSYNTYDIWSFYPPLIFWIVWTSLHFVVGVVLRRLNRVSERKWKYIFPYILRYSKIVFRGALKEENNQFKFMVMRYNVHWYVHFPMSQQ